MRIRITLSVDIDREGKATSKVEGWQVVTRDESLGSAVDQVFAQLVNAKPVVTQTEPGPERPRGGARELAVARMWADRVGLKREDLDQGVEKYNVGRVIEVLTWMSRQQPRNPAAMFWNVLGKS